MHPGCWRRRTINSGTHTNSERFADGAHGLGAKRVRADARNPSVLLVEAIDRFQRFAARVGAKRQHDRLAIELGALDTRRLAMKLGRPFGMTMHHRMEEAPDAVPVLNPDVE